MKNLILKFEFFYRLYQKVIRRRRSEYDFIKYIFSQTGKVNVLDLCCGDSYILNFINNNIENYIGLDNNENYLKNSKLKYPKFKFINSNIENINKIKELDLNNIDFIFLNGAIHHLNDDIVENLLSFLNKKYPSAQYLTIDPIIYNNRFLNKIMINFDRGNFIRDTNKYKILMKKFDSFITDDFFIMSFKLIFHYKNIDLEKIYKNWKNLPIN
ncbi:MAG: class I SAM-dependent methyltransferase [Candidatus Pelagibacter sp.]